MAGDWPEHSLSDLVEDILDRRGVTPLKLGSDFTGSGYRVISAKLIKDRRVDLAADEARFVDADTYTKWMRTPLQADDVILTSEAPLGEVAYLAKAHEWCLGQRLFGLRTKKQRLHGRYLFYSLQSEGVRHDLLSRATGTTAQGIRQSELRHVRIAVPPLDEQRAISQILGTLDDKIELNRRMNETMEEMARALFKSWFVDFDPVRRKAQGGDSGLPVQLADLFPSRVVGSELGEIPDGWRIGTWSDSVDLSRDSRNPGDVPTTQFLHFSIPAYDEGQEPRREMGADIKSLKFTVRPNDILLSKLNPAIERVWHVDLPTGALGVCSTEFLVLRARPPFERAFVYCAARSSPFRNAMQGLVTGTSNSHQRVQPQAILGMPTVLPPQPALAAFDMLAKPLLMRAQSSRRESRSLAATRDALLPKLISGELRVKATDRFLDMVTV